MFQFKQICIKNTIKLNKYASKLSAVPGVFNKNNLIITIEKSLEIDQIHTSSNSTHNEQDLTEINNTSTELDQIQSEVPTNTPSVNLKKTQFSNISSSTTATLEGVPMYSVSLNKWDLFETKYTCRCIKEFSSFTENTKHLCKNCEGELLGFRLSKIKVGVAEARYNTNLAKIKREYEDTDSDNSEIVHLENTNSNDCERGFDYNDVLLCKVHVNGVKKQINQLEDNICSRSDITTKSSINFINSDKFSCPVCNETFSSRYLLNNHYLLHTGNKLHECDDCDEKFIDINDFDKHKLKHNKQNFSTPTIKIETITPTTSKSLPFISDQSDSEEEDHNISKSKNTELNSSGEFLACGTCDKLFASKGKLAIHLMTHFGKKDYKCSICHKEFFRKENLDLHFETHQNMSTPSPQHLKYKCTYCDEKYNNISHIRRHMREVHDTIQYICVVCDEVFYEKHKLQHHILDEHTIFIGSDRIKKYKCPYCDKNYFKASNVRRHMNDSHDLKKFSCSICCEIFTEKHKLDEHFSNLHLIEPNENVTINGNKLEIVTPDGVRKYKCPYCDKSYNHHSNVLRHARKHHNVAKKKRTIKEEIFEDDSKADITIISEDDDHCDYEENDESKQNIKKYECPKCGKTYRNAISVRRHVREIHGINKFVCVFCNEMFDEKITLDEHISNSHNTIKSEDEEENEPKNDDNNQEIVEESTQIQDFHLQHTRTKKYKCTYCDKRYFHLSNVRRHMRENHDVNKYLCSICNETFTEKRILEQHIFGAHTQTANKSNSVDEDEQETFTCPVCNKHFNHLSNLRMHALSHTESEAPDDFNYCKICKKRISKNSSMSRHIMTHTSGKIYDCCACTAKFDNRWVFRQHMKSKHPNFVPEFKCKDCFKTYSTNFSLKKHRRIHTE